MISHCALSQRKCSVTGNCAVRKALHDLTKSLHHTAPGWSGAKFHCTTHIAREKVLSDNLFVPTMRVRDAQTRRIGCHYAVRRLQHGLQHICARFCKIPSVQTCTHEKRCA